MAKPRQQDLPGVERQMKDIDAKAQEYAETRDARQALTPKEVALKQELLTLMKRHRITEYKYNGVEVTVVTEAETVKVKIAKPDREEEE